VGRGLGGTRTPHTFPTAMGAGGVWHPAAAIDVDAAVGGGSPRRPPVRRQLEKWNRLCCQCLRRGGGGGAAVAAAGGRPLPPPTRTRRPAGRSAVGGGGKRPRRRRPRPAPRRHDGRRPRRRAGALLPAGSAPAPRHGAAGATAGPPPLCPSPPSPPRPTRRQRRGARGTAASGSAGGTGDSRRRVRPGRLRATNTHDSPPSAPPAPTNAPPKPLHRRRRRRRHVRPRGASTLKPPIPPSPPPPPSEAASPASAAHWPAGSQAVVGRRARASMVRRCASVIWRDPQSVHCCSHPARNVNKLCDGAIDWLPHLNPTLLPIKCSAAFMSTRRIQTPSPLQRLMMPPPIIFMPLFEPTFRTGPAKSGSIFCLAEARLTGPRAIPTVDGWIRSCADHPRRMTYVSQLLAQRPYEDGVRRSP